MSIEPRGGPRKEGRKLDRKAKGRKRPSKSESGASRHVEKQRKGAVGGRSREIKTESKAKDSKVSREEEGRGGREEARRGRDAVLGRSDVESWDLSATLPLHHRGRYIEREERDATSQDVEKVDGRQPGEREKGEEVAKVDLHRFCSPSETSSPRLLFYKPRAKAVNQRQSFSAMRTIPGPVWRPAN